MALLSLSSLLLLASPAIAGSDISYWYGLAGTQIQSKIFLSGGILAWGNGTWTDGSGYANSNADQGSLSGLIYQIDLEQSINIYQNETTDYLVPAPQTLPGGKPGFMNIAGDPGYAYGAIFNNDYTWFTFGGLATSNPVPGISTITRGIEFQQAQGVFTGPSLRPNLQLESPVSTFSEYIADGSYVSSPDQGMGWWFGGLASQNHSSPITLSASTDGQHANLTSRLFIQATIATDGSNDISFTYLNIPSWLKGRAESALTWLPYGNKGVLVLIGGVDNPATTFTNPGPADNAYMTELAIYDIDGQVWYNQSTLETTQRPGPMAAFCTAVVPTADGHGHEIFVYGGYDGTYTTDQNPYNDVWVLSVPAFQWTKVYDGSANISHARQYSVCIAPNPSTLMTIGGSGANGVALSTQHGVDMFDLNKLTWTGVYNASSNETLKVPSAVIAQIGGDENGPGASVKTSQLGNMGSLFAKAYQGEVQTYYPYASATTSTSPSASNSTTPATTTPHKSNTALIAALATVIPVVVIAAAILAFCCMKKRRKNQEGVERTQGSRANVSSWLRKSSAIDPPTDKSHTSDETAVAGTEYNHDKQPISEVYEAPGSNPTTPGWGTHGSPRVLSGSMATSPFMGSAEVDAQSRHEIMDHAPRDGQSLRQHHMYPRSLSGDQVMSVRSDSISHASTGVMPSRHYGYVSPYEMAHDRSHEDLATPPADVSLGAPRTEANPNASTHSLGVGAEHVHSPVALLPVAPFQRKPVDKSAGVEDDRPRHQRNQSSMSSDLPNLPSPGPEEDRRRSRLIDTLPDPKSGQTSPVQPQTAKKSVYTENLDA